MRTNENIDEFEWPESPFWLYGLEHFDAGWPVFPVNGKQPLMAGVTGREGVDLTREQVADEAERYLNSPVNFALRMPHGVIALDIDAYHGGMDTLADLTAKFGSLPPAPAHSVNRDDGSGHLFFRVPVGVRLQGDAGPGIDIIQRHHRYAVAPGSIHKSGRRYHWVDPGGQPLGRIPSPEEFPALPAKWLEHLAGSARPTVSPRARKRSARPPRRYNPPAAPTITTAEWFERYGDGRMHRVVRQRLRHWLRELVSGDGRHDAMAKGIYCLIGLGQDGYPGAKQAMRQYRRAFVAAVTSPGEGRRSEREAKAEWTRARDEAVQKIYAEWLTGARAR